MKNQPKGFWKVIEYINWKELAERGGNTDLARERMLEKVNTIQSIDFIKDKDKNITLKEFRDTFEELTGLIVDEVNNRIEKKKSCFAKGVDCGADDCHYMDMPAHLVGLGRGAVLDFLRGKKIEHEVVECLAYMFQE